MLPYKQYIRAITLNWIHLAGFYCCIEIMMIAFAGTELMHSHDWKNFFLSVLILAPILMFAYGLIVLIPFLVVIVLLDVILLSTINRSLLFIGLVEWVLISPIFVYWAVQNDYWLWFALIFSFLVTQLIRSKKLNVSVPNHNSSQIQLR